jgi:hypothetical protein
VPILAQVAEKTDESGDFGDFRLPACSATDLGGPFLRLQRFRRAETD